MKIKHLFQKKGDWVVVGKGFPRSVGLKSLNCAVNYSDYFKEKGFKTRIIRIK